ERQLRPPLVVAALPQRWRQFRPPLVVAAFPRHWRQLRPPLAVAAFPRLWRLRPPHVLAVLPQPSRRLRPILVADVASEPATDPGVGSERTFFTARDKLSNSGSPTRPFQCSNLAA